MTNVDPAGLQRSGADIENRDRKSTGTIKFTSDLSRLATGIRAVNEQQLSDDAVCERGNLEIDTEETHE